MARALIALVVTLALTACAGRPLTEGETAFLKALHGPALDTGRVRLFRGPPARAVTFQRPARPRITCRERILPPPEGDTVTVKPAAVALFNSVIFDRDWYLDDYLPDYPDRIGLAAAMLLAHEMTHAWQWQNRAITGYHPLRAAAEHSAADPYLFTLDEVPAFLEFGFEQQGAIVEEYVCCRALAPEAARTERLHAMISAALPVTPLPRQRAHDVSLPWDGIELAGICD